MFKASLENNNIPELGTVTVEFPIPEDQYEETIRALEKIKIGTTLDKDCCVADLRSTDCPALRRMINRMANVDELDWLGNSWRASTGMSCCNSMQRQSALGCPRWAK